MIRIAIILCIGIVTISGTAWTKLLLQSPDVMCFVLSDFFWLIVFIAALLMGALAALACAFAYASPRQSVGSHGTGRAQQVTPSSTFSPRKPLTGTLSPLASRIAQPTRGDSAVAGNSGAHHGRN